MPQATDELREWATKRFGDIDAFGPQEFLREHGFTLTKEYWWEVPARELTADEWRALEFLYDEWDYGWIVDVK